MRVYKGSYIKHFKFMDVCIKVINCFDYGHGVTVTGQWWNLGQVNSFPINPRGVRDIRLNIAKHPKDLKKGRSTLLKDWLSASIGSDDLSLRNANWR